jgi:hypothetical protein
MVHSRNEAWFLAGLKNKIDDANGSAMNYEPSTMNLKINKLKNK